jgi:uncharacterized lipoprotein YajG
MKTNMLAGLALAGLVGLSACATSEDIVAVPYTASAATATPGAQNIHVTVASSDARTENRARIGAKVNGYGMEMAAIRAQAEVTEIVRDAIAAELVQRGYQVGETGSRVNAEVKTFYNDFSTGLLAGKSKADVALTVTVNDRSGAEVYRREIAGQAERTVQMASGGNAAKTLSEALTEALGELMADPAFVAALAR